MTASIKVLISSELSSPVRAFGQERGQNEAIWPAESNEMKHGGSLKTNRNGRGKAMVEKWEIN